MDEENHKGAPLMTREQIADESEQIQLINGYIHKENKAIFLFFIKQVL